MIESWVAVKLPFLNRNMNCKICQCLVGSNSVLSRHLKKEHGLTPKEYFDRFIEPFKHKCPYCERECKFVNIDIGYRQSCDSKICRSKNNSLKQLSIEVKNKRSETCFKKYGVKNPFQAEEVKEEIKKTFQEKYGCEYGFQSSEVKERIKQTKLERYNNEYYLNHTKTKNTCFKKYGVKNPFQAEEVKERIKKTWQKKYGTENPSKNKEIREKIKQTCLEKYGVPSYSQTLEYAQRSRKKYPYDGLSFDSQDELKFYKHCKDLGLSVKYQPCSFKYTDSLKRTHTYFPDFSVDGQLYEVKGDHLWKDNHIWFPYRNTLSEQQLKEIDARDLAKTECMKEHGVKVILSSELGSILNE